MDSFKRYFTRNYLPRWVILLFDLAVAISAWFSAFVLRFNFDLSSVEKFITPLHLTIVLPVFVLCCWVSKCYSGILRHTTIKDVKVIVLSVLSSGVILMAISIIGRQLSAPPFVVMPMSVIVIYVMLVSTFMVLSRLIAKMLFQNWIIHKSDTKKIMIYGAGDLGQATLNALTNDHSVQNKVVGIIENNISMQNKYISGIPIYSLEKSINEIIPKKHVSEIIIATNKSELKYIEKRKIIDQFLKLHLLVKEVPPIQLWINGELQAKSIQLIRIEDLLGRNSIQLDRNKIERGLKNSVVLVTGAAGSIGSEIVRQLISFGVKKVILLDKAESELYNLQQDIIASKNLSNFEIIVGDVTNKRRVRDIFMKHLPTIVFNAAAYKHVPLMEEFPHEALRVNVGGIVNIAELSLEFGVEKFVMISSDKAVNPTNIMGTTKRISEIYVQSLAQARMGKTQFITTRFGNVLGSNGSVVPLFKKQIEKGGPVTITHKDITRYFMTIPEACQLVLEAGFMGKGGEIFVFDMGEPIKIYDLAKKMISLSGFVPEEDILIKEIGLRPGEKLYEELLGATELLTQTHNDKILIGKHGTHDYNIVYQKISNLLENLDDLDYIDLYILMKDIVPEYATSNTKFNTGLRKKPEYVDKKIRASMEKRQKVLIAARAKEHAQKHQVNFF